jgi:hypothetical protein
MASTRNINTMGNYYLEEKQYQHSRHYTLYPNSQYGSAYSTNLPGNGLNPGQIYGGKFSQNPIEIESFLFGINSTNLVNPQEPLTPELKNLSNVNVFESQPIIMPKPLVIEKGQRPFPTPGR